MRMPWKRREVEPPEHEATAARKRAEAQLERVRAETPMYAALGQRLREIRERNHFVESIETLFQGRS